MNMCGEIVARSRGVLKGRRAALVLAVLPGLIVFGKPMWAAEVNPENTSPEKKPTPAAEAKKVASKAEKVALEVKAAASKEGEVRKVEGTKSGKNGEDGGGKFRGRTISGWIEELRQPDRERRFKAIEALSFAGPLAVPAIPALVELLHNPKFGPGAAVALGCIGPKAVDRLIPLLDHRDVMVRVYAIDALGMIGSGAAKAVPKIIVALDDRETRFPAVTALSGIGTPALSALRKLTASDKAVLREMAISALAYSGPTALPYLRKAVTDEDLMVKLVAILALEDMGPAAKPAAPELASILRDSNPTVRRLAREALVALERPTLAEMEERTARAAAREAADEARRKERETIEKALAVPHKKKEEEERLPEPGKSISD